MAHRITYHLRQIGEEWVMMSREDVGEVFQEPSKKDAISRAHEIASASGHPCVVVTHHENGIAERKSFG